MYGFFVYTNLHLIKEKIELDPSSCSLTIIQAKKNPTALIFYLKSLPLFSIHYFSSSPSCFDSHPGKCCLCGCVQRICGGLMPWSNLNTSVCFFLCTRRVLNYLLQKRFFPLHRHAACRLRLFDNQPPARWLRHSLTPTRTKCMWTDSLRAHALLQMTAEIWGSCKETQEHGVGIRAFISLPTVKLLNLSHCVPCHTQ